MSQSLFLLGTNRPSIRKPALIDTGRILRRSLQSASESLAQELESMNSGGTWKWCIVGLCRVGTHGVGSTIHWFFLTSPESARKLASARILPATLRFRGRFQRKCLERPLSRETLRPDCDRSSNLLLRSY